MVYQLASVSTQQLMHIVVPLIFVSSLYEMAHYGNLSYTRSDAGPKPYGSGE